MWNYVLHDYQKQRVLTLLNPESDPLGAGYHIIQSKIAIGSGGLYGKGWLNGSQSQLDFLPESHTDFIFAVLAEETGLIGFLVLMALYQDAFILLLTLQVISNAFYVPPYPLLSFSISLLISVWSAGSCLLSECPFLL